MARTSRDTASCSSRASPPRSRPSSASARPRSRSSSRARAQRSTGSAGACPRASTTRCSPPGTAWPVGLRGGRPRARAPRLRRRRRGQRPSSSRGQMDGGRLSARGRTAGRGSPAISRTTPWSAPRSWRVRGDVRPPLARRVAPARRGGPRPVLGREREAFFDTGTDHEALVVRPRNLFDNAVPSGTSVAIEWLLRLAAVLGEARYEAIALEALRPMADLMTRYPTGFGRYLSALDFHLGPVTEVALVGPRARKRRPQPCSTRCSTATCPTASWRERPSARRSTACRSSPTGTPWAASPPRMSAGATCASFRPRSGGAGPPARGWGILRVRRGGRSPENRVRPGTPRTCTG